MTTFLQSFNWHQLLLGDEDWGFLAETFFRSLIMFIVLLLGLQILGKRGVKQLSVFELVVIIGLGSAAGDPMFYKDVGLLPAVIVFIMVVGLYKLVTYFVAKSKKFEHLIEGRPVCLISEGKFAIESFKKESLAQDEFFAELRMANVKHLGQVEQAYIETSGNLSIFYYPDDKVKFGLPILPEIFNDRKEEITTPGIYSCTFCGTTLELTVTKSHNCPACNRKKWVRSMNDIRLS